VASQPAWHHENGHLPICLAAGWLIWPAYALDIRNSVGVSLSSITEYPKAEKLCEISFDINRGLLQ